MKPKEYKKEFSNVVWNDDLKKKFHTLFSIDFKTTVDVACLQSKNGELSIPQMENLLRAAEEKLKSIKYHLPIEEGYWDYFMQNVGSKLMAKHCASHIRNRKRAQQKRDRYENYWTNMGARMFEEHCNNVFESLKLFTAPVISFKYLNIEPTKDVTTITKAYKLRAQELHPDSGGSHDAFVQLTEARNLCLLYAKDV